MTYTTPARRVFFPLVSFTALVLSVATGCGSDSGSGAGGSSGTGGTGGGPMGCLVQDFQGEPDAILFPLIEERQLPPGSTVTFTMFVDADTRLVSATLMDAWRLRDTPQGMSSTSVQNTAEGNEMLTFAIPIQTTGRYYVDFELCGASCDEQRIVYTLNRANAGPMSDAINDPYERIVYNGDVEGTSSFTCDNPDSIAIQ